MAYFNHAFQKTFLATGATLDDANVTDPFTGDPVTVSSDEGYLTTTGLPTYVLNGMSSYQKQFPYSSPSDLSTWQSILTIRLVHLLEVILRLTSLR